MGRDRCDTCETLKELYWLKLNQLFIAAKSNSGLPGHGQAPLDDEMQKLMEDALDAARGLLHHAQACYGAPALDDPELALDPAA